MPFLSLPLPEYMLLLKKRRREEGRRRRRATRRGTRPLSVPSFLLSATSSGRRVQKACFLFLSSSSCVLELPLLLFCTEKRKSGEREREREREREGRVLVERCCNSGPLPSSSPLLSSFLSLYFFRPFPFFPNSSLSLSVCNSSLYSFVLSLFRSSFRSKWFKWLADASPSLSLSLSVSCGRRTFVLFLSPAGLVLLQQQPPSY